ncbi:MAG: ribosome biogenesis GTPase YlqF [Betaproteobacteria bacterium]
MSINWFPGHMVKAVDKAKKAMANHDVVIEVLDARCPMASSNPVIQKMREFRQRPCLRVLNKADAADLAVTREWLAFYNAQANTRAIAISCKKPGDAAKVIAEAQALAPHRTGKLKALRMMIMGVPNVGKSTLINALMNKRTAKVGDEPAVTKLLHRYDLSSTAWLTDTPGLMWPRIKHESDGLMLAASNMVGTGAYIDSEVALFLADLLLVRYPQALAARYGFPSDADTASGQAQDGVALIEAIAKKRGYLLKGVGPDFEKAALALLGDYRSGALGRISLETPDTRAAMVAAAATAADAVASGS